jgi:hypothetical protein
MCVWRVRNKNELKKYIGHHHTSHHNAPLGHLAQHSVILRCEIAWCVAQVDLEDARASGRVGQTDVDPLLKPGK